MVDDVGGWEFCMSELRRGGAFGGIGGEEEFYLCLKRLVHVKCELEGMLI